MSKSIGQKVISLINSVLLWGYGWKYRREVHFGELAVQWRDPLSGMWYRQPTAMKLLKIQALDELDRK